MKTIIEIPETKKVLNLYNVGDLRLEEIPLEKLAPNTVLVKIKACGICSSDIPRIFENGTYHFPTVPGHEFSGQVVATYDDENSELLGRKVAVFPLIPCKTCRFCKAGDYALCENYDYFGSRRDGGFSEYLVVPKWNLILLNDDVDYCEAALCEPAAVALHAVHQAKIEKGKTVLIIGTGTIGFLIGKFCQVLGAEVVMGCRNNNSKSLASSFGFKIVNSSENMEDELMVATDNNGADIVFEAVGTNVTLNSAILNVNPKGRIVLVGNPHSDMSLEKKVYWRILRKELEIVGTWNSNYGELNNEWVMVSDFLNSHSISLKSLISETFCLEDYDKAFAKVRSSDFTLKVMFKEDGDDFNGKG